MRGPAGCLTKMLRFVVTFWFVFLEKLPATTQSGCGQGSPHLPLSVMQTVQPWRKDVTGFLFDVAKPDSALSSRTLESRRINLQKAPRNPSGRIELIAQLLSETRAGPLTKAQCQRKQEEHRNKAAMRAEMDPHSV